MPHQRPATDFLCVDLLLTTISALLLHFQESILHEEMGRLGCGGFVAGCGKPNPQEENEIAPWVDEVIATVDDLFILRLTGVYFPQQATACALAFQSLDSSAPTG